MKIFAQVLFILIILNVLCDGNKRPKRTLGTLLRFFGYKVIPIDDVEFVTESIPESTRNPKALRINTQRPSIKVEVEETTMKSRKTTTTQSIPKFNPLLPDIINSMFQINLTTMRSPLNVRNSTKKTTLKPNKVKGTEFLIRPMEMPNVMLQKLTDPMMQSPPEMPQVLDMMQPPAMQMSSQGMQMNIQGMQMNQQGMPIQSMNMQGMPMQMNSQEMAINQQGMPMQMNSQDMSDMMQPQMLSGLMESTTLASINASDSMMPSMDSPPTQSMSSQPMNAVQNPEIQAQNFQSLPGFPQQLQNFGNFEMVKSRELPSQQFPSQYIVGNSISVSDFVNTHQHLPFQTHFHTQFSTPHASHFTIARSGKELKFNNYNYPLTYYH
ncbi:unnamed protein product [Chironomus riparius]|uniref:Uncharacterized protein n=1 Tax=Chironomus riparius TaxID=315576 RepID=A0A9N9S0U7_9DIPT|nr:unnamed protein product [Chironomus riparius]